MLISNLLKKFHKNSHIDKLTNMSKSEKVHINVRLLLKTFFVWNFCQPFSTDSKSASNSSFFYNHIAFLKKKFFASNFEVKHGLKRLKIEKHIL
jgi:hypothetical protein